MDVMRCDAMSFDEKEVRVVRSAMIGEQQGVVKKKTEDRRFFFERESAFGGGGGYG